MMANIKRIFLGFFVLLTAVIVYLVVIIFFPVLSVPKQPITKQTKKKNGRKKVPPSRQDVQFSVDGTQISGWLYLPEDTSTPVPCVVLGQGFGGTKDCGSEPYALRFNQAGFAALTFDYRHFGESAGEPRQLFDVSFQLEDLKTAVTYARSRSEIDPEKIVVWGTSASGGYGLVLAAEDKQIAAVIAQCPGIDHDADSKLFMEREGLGYLLRLLVHAQRDKGRSRFGLSPHTFPIVGQPGTTAMLSAPSAFDGYSKLTQESETFQNEVCARLFFMGHGPDPSEVAKDVHCPVLFLICEHDNLVAPNSHAKAAKALGAKATVKSFPIGHFDIYEGECFEQAMHEQLCFLNDTFESNQQVIGESVAAKAT